MGQVERQALRMTESEWEKSDDPVKMLEAYFDLCKVNARDASHRKLRLFLCARMRSYVDANPQSSRDKAIEVAEAYADGLASVSELEEAADATGEASWVCCRHDVIEAIWRFCEADYDSEDVPEDVRVMRDILGNPWSSMRRERDVVIRAGDLLVVDAQGRATVPPRSHVENVHLLGRVGRAMRNVFAGDEQVQVFTGVGEFMLNVPQNDLFLERWLTPDVLRIAQEIYEDRRFDELPVLADALEIEGGCDHTGLLGHLRSPGPHYKGMWSLDLILGKS